MSDGFARKRRVIVALLVVCVVWPLAHRALVARYEFDPWYFFGWAMYTRPDVRVELRVAALRYGRVEALRLSPALEARAKAWADRRAVLGRLSPPPDGVARSVFEAHPEVGGLVVGVRRFVVDPRTGMVEPRDRVYRYEDRSVLLRR